MLSSSSPFSSQAQLLTRRAQHSPAGCRELLRSGPSCTLVQHLHHLQPSLPATQSSSLVDQPSKWFQKAPPVACSASEIYYSRCEARGVSQTSFLEPFLRTRKRYLRNLHIQGGCVRRLPARYRHMLSLRGWVIRLSSTRWPSHGRTGDCFE